MEHLRLLLLVVFVLSLTNAKPLNNFLEQTEGSDSSCWQPCPNDLPQHQRLPLKGGSTITYSYVADTLTSIHETDADKTGLQFQMQVHIDGLSSCQARLRLSNVTARHWDAKSKEYVDVPTTDNYKNALESQELVFTYVDGQVEQVCKHKKDLEWIANIKRAILSTLQFKLNQPENNQMETDISGECPVKMSGLSSNVYLKVKKLESCSGHTHSRSTINSAMYHSLPHAPKSLPITEMKSSCNYTLDDTQGTIQDVQCAEEHLLRPFRNGGNGARTISRQKLTLQHVRATNINKISVAEHFDRSHITYVTPSKEERNQGRKVTAEDVAQQLWRLCQLSDSDVRPQTPQFFTELVYQMRLLDMKQLQILNNLVRNEDTFKNVASQARTFFYDAMALVNTDAGFQMMLKLVNSNELSDQEVNMWIGGLSFLQEAPSKNMLITVKTLLEAPKLRKASLFSVTTMLNRYCHQQGYEACQKDQEIVEIVNILLNHLNGDCSLTQEQSKNEAITMLKSLGNIGFDLGKMTDTLNRCAHRKENPISIRVAAIQSIQRLSCDTSRTLLDDILMDPELDSELRINVYLANMRCPSSETLRKVKDVLEKEKVNQVGSFIWTHLTNLKETQDPLKKEIRDILQTTSLKQEFDLDKLKFSRNVEKSFFSDEYNFGGQLESNLIWSQESFFPRSVSLNVTADLFGAAVNFLELNGRVEHADKILEKLFGPKSESMKYNPSMYLEALNELEGSLGMRIFGRDIGVLYADSNKQIPSSFTFRPFEILEALLSGRKYDIQKNLLMVESSLEMPTATGLPLSFSVNVSSSVDIQYFSHLQYVPGQSGRLENHLEPSAAVVVSAHMAIDSISGKYGVKLISNLHTSSHVVTSILYDSDKGLRVEFNMPKEKQEVISFQSEVFVVQHDEERDQRAALDEVSTRMVCTGATVETLLGMELCAAVSYPHVISENFKAPLFPLRGPVAAHVTLIKRDTLRGYLFAVKAKPVDESKTHYRWEINTPQSKISRHFLAEFEFDMSQKKLKVAWKDPWRSAGLQLEVGSKDIVARMHINDNDLVLVEGHRAVSMKGDEIQHEGTFEVRIPFLMGSRSIQANALLSQTQNVMKYKAEVSGLLKAPLSIDFSITRVNVANKGSLVDKLQVIGAYSSPIYRGELAGSVEYNTFSHKVDLTMKHQKVQLSSQKELKDIGQPFKMALRHKWKGTQVTSRVRHDIKTRVSFGLQGEQYIGISLDTEASQRHANVKSAIDFNFKDTGKHKISVELYSGFVQKGLDHTFQVSGTFSYPQKNLEFSGKLHSKMNDLKYKGEMELLKNKKPLSTVEINWVNKGPRIFDSEMLAAIDILGKKISLRNNLHEVSFMRFENEFMAQIEQTILNMNTVFHSPSLKSFTFTHDIRHPYLGDGLRTEIIFDFENMAKSLIRAAIDFVNTKHKYGLEGILRYTPGKVGIFHRGLPSVELLEVSLRNWVPDLNATQRAQFVFTPKHLLASFNSVYNNEEVVALHGEIKHDDSIPRKFVDMLHLRLQYPGRKSSVKFQSDFQYLKFNAQLELSPREGKKITFATMYDINDGWTEKGITASATMTTPYKGYERMHLGLYGLGQLRYRKLAVEYHWGQGKRVVVDLTVHPKGMQDFTSAFRIITPFTRMSYLGFHVKHFYNGKQINTETRLDLGPTKNYGISLKLTNNGDNRVRDVQGEIKVSAYRLMREMTVRFSHRDDLKNFKTDFNVDWGAGVPLSFLSSFDFILERNSLKTRGNVQLAMPWNMFKSVRLEWKQMNTDTSFLTDLKMYHNKLSLLEGNVRGSFTRQTPYKINANFDLKFLNKKNLRGSYDLIGENSFLKSEMRVSMDDEELYYDRWTIADRDGHFTAEMFMNVPFSAIQVVQGKVESAYRGPNYALASHLTYSDEDTKIFDVDASLTFENERINGKATYSSDWTAPLFKKFSLVHNMDLFRGQYHIIMKSELNDADLISYEATMDLREKAYLKLRMNSRFATLNSLELSLKQLGNWKDFDSTINLMLNDRHRLEGKLKQTRWQNVSTTWQMTTPQFTKSVEFKHEMTARTLKQKLALDLWRTARFSYLADLSLDENSEIRIETPFPEYCESLQLKLDRDMKETAFQINHLTTTTTNKLSAKLNVSPQKYKGSLSLKLGSYQGDGDVSLQKNTLTQKWDFRVNGNTQGQQGQFVITVDPSYSQTSFMLQTPFKRLSHLSGHFNLTGSLRDFYHSHSLRAVIGGKLIAFENILSHVGYSFAEFYSHFENAFDERYNYTVKYMHRVTPTRFYFHTQLQHKSIGNNELLIDKPLGQSLTVNLKTGLSYLQELSLTYQLSNINSWSDMKHMMAMKYRLKDLTYSLSGVLAWTGWNYVNLGLKMETPYSRWKVSELQVLHLVSQDTWKEFIKIMDHEMSLEKTSRSTKFIYTIRDKEMIRMLCSNVMNLPEKCEFIVEADMVNMIIPQRYHISSPLKWSYQMTFKGPMETTVNSEIQISTIFEARGMAKYKFDSMEQFSGRLELQTKLISEHLWQMEVVRDKSKFELKTVTPFKFIRNINMAVDFQEDGKNLAIRIDRNDKVMFNLHFQMEEGTLCGVKKAEMKLDLKPIMELVHFQLYCSSDSLEGTFLSGLTGMALLKLTRNSLEISIPEYRNLRATLSWEMEKKYQFSMKVTSELWNNGKGFGLDLSLTETGNSGRTLRLEVQTPLEKWLKTKMYFTLLSLRDTATYNLTGRIENEEILMTPVVFDGVFQASYDQCSMNVTYKAPIGKGYESGNFAVEYKYWRALSIKYNNPRDLRGSTYMKWELKDINGYDKEFVVSSSFELMKEMSVKFNRTTVRAMGHGQGWNTRMEYSFLPNGNVLVQITSAMSPVKNLQFKVDWNTASLPQQMSVTMHLTSELMDPSVEVTLKWDSKKELSLSLQSPFLFLQDLKLQATWDVQGYTNFKMRTMIQHEYLTEPIEGSVSNQQGKFKLSVKTPFEKLLKRLEVAFEMDLDKVTASAESEGIVTFDVKGTMSYQLSRYEVIYRFELDSRTFGNIDVMAQLKHTEPGIEARLSISTPLPGFEKQSVTFTNKNRNVIVVISQSMLSRDIEATLSIPEVNKIELSLQTPFRGLQSNKVIVTLHEKAPVIGMPQKIEVRSLEHGDWRLVNDYSEESDVIKMSYTLQTPLDMLRITTLNMEYKYAHSIFTLRNIIDNNYFGRYEMETRFAVNLWHSEIYMRVNTPLESLGNSEFRMKYEINSTLVDVTLFTRHKMYILMDVQVKANYIEQPKFTLNVNLPYCMKPLEVEFTSTSRDFRIIEGNVRFNQVELFTLSYTLNNGKIMLRTSIKGLQTVTLVVTTNVVSWTESVVSMNLETSTYGTFTSSWKHVYNKWNSPAEVHWQWQNTLVPFLSKASSIDFVINSNSIHVSSKMDHMEPIRLDAGWDPSKINIELDTPIKGYQRNRIYLEVSKADWKKLNVAAKVDVQIGSFRYVVSGEVEKQMDNTIQLHVSLPTRDILIRMKGKYSSAEVETYFALSVDRENLLTVNFNINSKQSHYKINLELSRLEEVILETKLDLMLTWRHSFITGHVQFYDQRYETSGKSEWDTVKTGSITIKSSSSHDRVSRVYKAGFAHRYINKPEEFLLGSSLKWMDMEWSVKIMTNKRSRALVKLMTPLKLLQGELMYEYSQVEVGSQILTHLKTEYFSLSSDHILTKSGSLLGKMSLVSDEKEIFEAITNLTIVPSQTSLKSSIYLFNEKATMTFTFSKNETSGFVLNGLLNTSCRWIQTLGTTINFFYRGKLDFDIHTELRGRMFENSFEMKSGLSTASPLLQFQVVCNEERIVEFKAFHERKEQGVHQGVSLTIGGITHGYKLQGQLTPMFVGDIVIHCPWLNYPQLKFHSEKEKTQKGVRYTLRFGENQDMQVQLKEESDGIDLNVKSALPYMEDTTMVYRTLSGANQLIAITMRMNREETPSFTFTAKSKNEGSKYGGKVNIDSPLFPILDKLALEIHHEKVKPQEWKFQHAIRHNSGMFLQLNGTGSLGDQGFHLDGKAETHLGGGRLRLSHQNTEKGYNNEMGFVLPNKNVYHSSLNISKLPNQVVLFEHSLTTPSHHLGDVKTYLRHESVKDGHIQEGKVTRNGMEEPLLHYKGNVDWKKMHFTHEVSKPGVASWKTEVRAHEPFMKVELLRHPSNKLHYLHIYPLPNKESNKVPGWKLDSSCPYLKSAELFAKMPSESFDDEDLMQYIPQFVRFSLNDKHWLQVKNNDSLHIESSHPLLTKLQIQTENQPMKKSIRVKYDRHVIEGEARQDGNTHLMKFSTTFPRDVTLQVQFERTSNKLTTLLRYKMHFLETTVVNNETNAEFSLRSSFVSIPEIVFQSTKSLSPLEMKLKIRDKMSQLRVSHEQIKNVDKLNISLSGDLLPIAPSHFTSILDVSVSGVVKINLESFYDENPLLSLNYQGEGSTLSQYSAKASIGSPLWRGKIEGETNWAILSWSEKRRDAKFALRIQSKFEKLRHFYFNTTFEKSSNLFVTVKAEVNDARHMILLKRDDQNKKMHLEVEIFEKLTLLLTRAEDIKFNLKINEIYGGAPLSLKLTQQNKNLRFEGLTPLPALRAFLWTQSYAQVDSVHILKAQGAINTREVLNVTGSYMWKDDSILLNFTSHRPRPLEFSFVFKTQSDLKQLNFFLNWNPRSPGQYILVAYDRTPTLLIIKLGHQQKQIHFERKMIEMFHAKITRISTTEEPGSIELLATNEKERFLVTLSTPWRSSQLSIRQREITWTRKECILELLLDMKRPEESLVRLQSDMETSGARRKAQLRLFYPGRMEKPATMNVITTYEGSSQLVDMSLELTENMEDTILLSMVLPQTINSIYDNRAVNLSFTAQRKGGKTFVSGQLGFDLGGETKIFITGLQMKQVNEPIQKYLLHFEIRPSSLDGLLHLNMVTPMNSCKITSTLKRKERDVYMFQLENEINAKPLFNLSSEVNSTAPAISFKLHGNADRLEDFIEIIAGYKGDYEMGAKVTATASDMKYLFLDTNLKLISDHLVQSKLFIKKGLCQQISHNVKVIKKRIQGAWFNNENALKLSSHDFTREFFSFSGQTHMSSLSNEMDLLLSDLGDVMQAMKQSYDRNDFYLKTVIGGMSHQMMKVLRALEWINRWWIVTRHEIYRTMGETLFLTVDTIMKFINGIRYVQNCLYRNLSYLIIQTAEFTAHVTHRVASTLVYWVEKIFSHVNLYRFAEIAWIPSWETLSPHLRPFVSFYKTTLSQVRDGLASTKYMLSFVPFETEARVLVDRIIHNINEQIINILPNLRAARNQVEYWFNNIISPNTAMHIGNLIKESLYNAKWFLENVYTIESLTNMLMEDYFGAIRYIKEVLLNSWGDLLNLNQFYVLDHSNRESFSMESQMYIPMVMKDLKSSPEFMSLSSIVENIQQSRLFSYRSKLWETFEPHFQTLYTFGWSLPYLKSATRRHSVWPQFEEFASLTPNQVVTFDKKHFTLNGDSCDYTLVTPTTGDQSWSVNTENNRKVIVARLDSATVKMDENKQVFVNGKMVDLPAHIGNSLSIYRYGRFLKLKDNEIGLSITADPENGLVTVGVSRWHHGKLGGLFGNMDAEPFNDFIMKNKALTTEKGTFLNSWSNGNSCKRQTKDMNKEKSFTRQHAVACQMLFSFPLSPLANCFKHVDPRPFERLCLAEGEISKCPDGVNDCTIKHVCKSVNVYASQCHHANIKVDIPSACQSCSGDTQNPTHISPTKAEVVFITEEGRGCNNRNIIRELSASIRNVYHQRGIWDVSFAVVAYNTDVHTHTFNGKVFVDDRELGKIHNVHKFSEAGHLNGMTDDRSMAMQAIEYATYLPFQPDSNKQIIMLPCTSCGSLDNTLSNLLQQMEIHYTVMMRTHSTRNADPQKRFYAMDRVNIYHPNTPLGTPHSLHKLALPEQDGCFALAMRTNGMVYDREAEILLTRRPIFYRMFTMNTNRRAMQYYKKPIHCTCEPNSNYGSRRICQT